jgi:hypothetical protein
MNLTGVSTGSPKMDTRREKKKRKTKNNMEAHHRKLNKGKRIRLVFVEKAVFFQMLPNLMNADLAFPILTFISLSAPTSVAIQLPR